MADEPQNACGETLAAVRLKLRRALERYSSKSGYFFNSSEEVASYVIEQLAQNRLRYGLAYCPCKLREDDLASAGRDIICPCAYHKQEIDKYGQCDCALFVSK